MQSKFSSLIGLVLTIAWVGWGHAASTNGVPTYLALGDSLAYGMQIGHLRQEMKSGTVDAASFDTGYVNRLAAALRHSTPNLHVVDLGCPGETTSSFIDGPCAFATNGKPFGHKPLPMHVEYKGAQLLAGLKYIENQNDNIRLITVDIGINDLRADELACGSASDFEKCLKGKWPVTAKNVAKNLSIILHNLRYAAPHTRILVTTYYNWLGLQHPRSDAQVRELNAIITRSARSIGATTIHTFPAFNESGNLCKLSLICGPTKDLHPTNAGYRLIAQLFYRGME
jgi:lysophospholipase L1-like esterase